MMITDLYKIPITASLAVIGAVLAVSVAASVIRNRIAARAAPVEEGTASK